MLRAGSFPEFKLAYVGTEEGIEAPSKLRSSSVENALLYLYNVGDNQGFVIVSGEDRGKQLLGISDKGSLPEKGLSATMENFMRMYIHYVKALRSGMPLAVDSVEASSTEGLRMADTTVESMAKCKKVLENIYMLADDLKNSVEENEEELSQKFDF